MKTQACWRVYLGTVVGGTALGFGLSRMGFSDYGELHKMFVAADLRLFLTFLAALTLTAAALRGLARDALGNLPPKPFHPGSVVGGVLFGLGWTLTGACPAVPFVHLGEGRLVALVTVVGALVGTFAYRALHARFFRWDRGACGA